MSGFFFIVLSYRNFKQLLHKKQTDKLLSFVNAIASGMDRYKAYIRFYAKNPKIKPSSARSCAAILLGKAHVQDLLTKALEVRKTVIPEIMEQQARTVGKEFAAIQLTTEEMDNFHSAVIQGQVEVVENITVYTWTDILDGKGKVIRRERRAGVMKATRPPNIKEKQVSIDALYRRRKAYPAAIPFGKDDDAEGMTIDFIMMADGTKQPLFSPKQIKG